VNIRAKALPTAKLRSGLACKVVIAPELRSTGIVPTVLSQDAADTRMSPSEKIVSGIAIGVLMAGFATGMFGLSAARSFYPQTLSRTSNTPQIGGKGSLALKRRETANEPQIRSVAEISRIQPLGRQGGSLRHAADRATNERGHG
jgi:hypothetical protein